MCGAQSDLNIRWAHISGSVRPFSKALKTMCDVIAAFSGYLHVSFLQQKMAPCICHINNINNAAK